MPHPFAVGVSAAIEKLFAYQIRALSPRLNSPVWGGRAVALVGCVAPAMVWLRDHKGIKLDFEAVRFATDCAGSPRRRSKASCCSVTPLPGMSPNWTSGANSQITSCHPCDATSPKYPATTSPFPVAQQTRHALDQHSFISLSCLPGFDQHHPEA